MTDGHTQAAAPPQHDGIDVLSWNWGTIKKPSDNGKGNKGIQQPLVGVNQKAKGACPQDMVAKGNSCVARERRIIGSGGTNPAGITAHSAFSNGNASDSRSSRFPPDLPGRR